MERPATDTARPFIALHGRRVKDAEDAERKGGQRTAQTAGKPTVRIRSRIKNKNKIKKKKRKEGKHHHHPPAGIYLA